MTNWNLLFRRTHLYLGLLLIPWVLVYALSTVMFNHAEYFRHYRAPDPQWFSIWEKDYALAAPAPAADDLKALEQTTTRILADHGLGGAFNVRRQGQRLSISLPHFWHPRRLAYDLASKKLRAEEKRFAWVELVARLHERTGYRAGGALNNVWAGAVDVLCVTTVVWIGTGLYMWWKLAEARRWGFAAIAGGLATIAVLALTL